MSWTVYGDTFDETSDLTGASKSQRIDVGRNSFLKAIRTRIILYNEPVFSGLSLKIFANSSQDNSPSKILGQSVNSYSSGELLISEPYGVSDLYFEFENLRFRKNDTYHVALSSETYIPSSSSHLAWALAWPDPVYDNNVTITANSLMTSPYMILSVVGAPF